MNGTSTVVPHKTMELTAKEAHLIEICRQTEYGKMEIYIEKRQPVRIEQLKPSILL